VYGPLRSIDFELKNGSHYWVGKTGNFVATFLGFAYISSY